MSHTRGPWRATGWDYVYDCAPVFAEYGMVAKGCYWGGTEQAKTNARLIAAAPDLLEALKEATDEVIACGGERHIQLDGAWLSKALAAIAKARGTSGEREQNGTKT